LGITYSETDHTMRQVRAAMVTRNNLREIEEHTETLRLLSLMVLKHGDAELSKRFCALVDWIAGNLPHWGNHVYQEELDRLRHRLGGATRRMNQRAPYRSAQARGLKADLIARKGVATQQDMAEGLKCDVKTFRKWGEDADALAADPQD